MSTLKLAEIAEHIGAELRGDPDCTINYIATIANAKSGQIAFLDNPKYRKYLKTTEASAVILSEKMLEGCETNALVSKTPYLAYAKVAALFDDRPKPQAGIHPTVVQGENCNIHPTAHIGAHTVLGDNVSVGEGVIIGPHCSLSSGVSVGASSCLYAHVTLYHKVQLGERVIVHSGAVIGSDGFGLANEQGRWQKVPQLGTVIIGNDVDIGSGTCIDRGAIEDTVIEDGVKLDNLIQVGHNVRIGAHTAIAGCVAIAGSAKIGRFCMIGGGCCIAGHLDITDGVILTGMTGIGKSINEPGPYSAGLPPQPTKEWKRSIFHYKRLVEMSERLKALEKKLA